MAGLMQQAKLAVTGEVQNNTMGPPHWQTGICGCTEDTGICCQTICCFPCTAANMINKNETGVAAFDCATCFCFIVGAYATNGRYLTWAAMGMRRAIIQRYGIQGETQCTSCMLGLCCAPCNYCQVQQEMAKRKEHCGGCCANPPPESQSLGDKVVDFVGKAAVKAMNNGIHGPHMWSSGMCDCGIGECCEGLFCGCCVFGFIGAKIDSDKVQGHATGENRMDCVSCCGSIFYPQGWTFQNRREIIERYNVIGESYLKSLCMVLCCPFCSLLQQRREMGYANEWPGGLIVKEFPRKQQQ